MAPLLFSKQVVLTDPAAPSWNHDPEPAEALAHRRFTFERACHCSQSDHYKERGLRFQMWNHLLGKAP